MPLHMLHLNILAEVVISISCFIKVDIKMLEKGIATVVHICVEVDLTRSLLDKLHLHWNNLAFTQSLDYENAIFWFRFCQ